MNTEAGEEADRESVVPVINAIEQIGTRWRVNIVYALKNGELRFNDLKRETGASSKTLSEKLDELENNNIIDRRVEKDSPIAVYYYLTSKGNELLHALSALSEWEQNWANRDT